MKLLDTSPPAQHTTRGLFEAVLANAGAESTRRPDTVSLRLSLGEEGATRFRPIASLPHTSLISPLCDVRTESRLPPRCRRLWPVPAPRRPPTCRRFAADA